MVRSRFDANHLVPVRPLRFDPLGVGRQSNGDCENNAFLHAQVSTDSCTAPKTIAQWRHARAPAIDQLSRNLDIDPSGAGPAQLSVSR
jgi:hypothetical protein